MILDCFDWEVDGVTVLNLSGRITLGDGTKILRKLIRDTLAQDKKRILLNMAEVFYIDSSGLGELVSAYAAVKNSGGQLKLLNLKSRVQDLMLLTRMHMVFEIYTDEKAALAGFREPQA
jgi:anti-sigma B factor antagonist